MEKKGWIVSNRFEYSVKSYLMTKSGMSAILPKLGKNLTNSRTSMDVTG